MDYETILTKTNEIINNLHSLDSNIVKIKKKIVHINKVFKKLSRNKILTNDSNNTYLLFQTNILQNEYHYYQNLYNIMIQKYTSEILELSEYIYMVLISLYKIEIDEEESKKKIFKKMIKLNKTRDISYGRLNEIINCTINNLKLIDEFIKLFDNYILKIKNSYQKCNIHNSSFQIMIQSKKDTILIEYNKYCSQFNSVIDYFNNCSECIVHQINNSKLLNFFLNENDLNS
tara:strand:+ start:686 stop:1378 length:693 start_codon:yes stop_codon:yes gene_type:complete